MTTAKGKHAKQLFPHFDPLSEALDATRLRFMLPGAHEMAAPWGIDFKPHTPKQMREHLASLGMEPPPHDPPQMRGAIIAIVRGNCCLEVPERKTKMVLSGGDVVLITGSPAFILRDDWRSPAKSVYEFVRRREIETLSGIRAGGSGAATVFFTGGFVTVDDEEPPFLAMLPPVVCVRGSDLTQAPWIESTLKFLNSELTTRAPGSQSLVNHLAHALFVQAVRAHAATLPDDAPANWFAALFDPELSVALGLIHLRPGDQWTVASLAEAAGMGRSSFAARFTASVGRSPLQYLLDCRFRKAREMLRGTRIAIGTIAARVGYSNESAFSNAFKRVVGVSPGNYRSQHAIPNKHGMPTEDHD